MSEWKFFLKEGQEYLQSARGKAGKPSRLSNDIRYNLLAMSFEKSCMALLMLHDDLADNHTFSDLLYSLKRHVAIPDKLSSEILALEQVQSICNLYEYHREVPSDAVVERLQQVAMQFYLLAEQTGASKHRPDNKPVIPS